MKYDLPDVVRVEADGPVRIVRLNRPEQLNAINEELHLGLTQLFPQLSADDDARVAVDHRRGARVLGGRRLRPPRPHGERPRVATRRHRRGSRARAQHDPVPRPGRGGGQRPGRRPRLQRDRALRRRVHGRVGVPVGPARDGRPRRGRRRSADVAAAHEPAARQGVRVHRRPDQRDARGRDRSRQPRECPDGEVVPDALAAAQQDRRAPASGGRGDEARARTCTSSGRCSRPSTSRWHPRASRSTRPICAPTSTASSGADRRVSPRCGTDRRTRATRRDPRGARTRP